MWNGDERARLDARGRWCETDLPPRLWLWILLGQPPLVRYKDTRSEDVTLPKAPTQVVRDGDPPHHWRIMPLDRVEH